MAFEPSLVYKILHPHFQQRVQIHEPLALHSSLIAVSVNSVSHILMHRVIL
jgi:hypothetical protein